MMRNSVTIVVMLWMVTTIYDAHAQGGGHESYFSDDTDMRLFPDDSEPNMSERRQSLVEARMQHDKLHQLQELYATSIRNHQELPQGYFAMLYAHGNRVTADGYNLDELFNAAVYRRVKRHYEELLATTTKDLTCPLPDKCSPHGLCMQNFGCTCYQNSANGYWRGTTCDECAFGYAGSSCTVECPGGSCNPCNSNGQCNQGSTGDGTCTCYTDASRGYWGPPDCSECADDYYGAECKSGCPGVDSGVICSGQGYCLDGVAGSGACVCNLGYDNATDCDSCDGAHFGDSCEYTCDGYVKATNLPCSGHGTCSSGVDGNGACTCNVGWAGLLCSTQCPGTSGDCNGHGVCHYGLLGNGTCTCSGNFAAPNCSVCIPDFTGVACNVSCAGKRTVSTDEVCTGRGTCTTSDQVNAVCECAAGYAGGFCQDACSGSPPCSGHGTCIYTTGTTTACNCSSGWGGTQCQSCTDAYANSTDCATACPTGTSGEVCSGRGVCIAGACYCNGFASCGTACELFDGCDRCSIPYYYGLDCSTLCPGTNLSVTPTYACNGNGLCGHDKSSSAGNCGCYFGFVGTSCNLTCTLGIGSLTCSGVARGVCIANGTNSAVCSCRSGFSGVACELTCPSSDGLVCGGNGVCNAITGACDCNAQWTGLTCTVPCRCNTAHGRCTSDCANYKATDVCTSCQCTGNFTDLCYTCKNGTQGTSCEGACLNGFTYATVCNCSATYGTASCSVMCPSSFNATLNASVVCSGRGTCSDGRLGDGLCHCYSGFYGLACETPCSASDCSTLLGKGQCNANTGACECQNDLEGYWQQGTGSTTCDTCVDGYWGPACTEACSCNDHGTCDQNTGECTCYADATKGFYSGTLCDSCSVGYLGASCTTESVLVSQLARNIYFVNGTAVSGSVFQSPPGTSTAISPITPVLLVDDLTQLRHVVVGGLPTVLVDATNLSTADASLLVLNTSSEFPQVFGPCGESAVAWKHGSRYYFLLQPIPTSALGSCAGVAPPTVVTMASSTMYNETWTPGSRLFTMSSVNAGALPEGGDPSSIAVLPLRVRVTATQSNTLVSTDEKKLFNGAVNMLLFVASRANTTNASSTSVSWSSGGTLVLTEFDVTSGAPVLHGGVALPSGFHATDIAISPYDTTSRVGLQRIVVSGYYSYDVTSSNATTSNTTTWEILETNIDTLRANLNSTIFQLSSLAAQSSVCWPDFPSETTSITFSASGSRNCTYCKEASRVQFYDANTLIVAFRAVQNADSDTVVMSLLNTTAAAISTAGLTNACGATATRIAYPARALAGDSRPTAIAIDYFTGMVFVASEMVSGDPSVLTKYLVTATTSSYSTRALTLNSVFDFASLFKTETVNQAEIIAALVIAPGSRLLYASSSGIPQVKVASFLLYEITSIEPKIASVYGTIVTLQGRGFKSVVNGGSSPTCFFDNASTPATILNATFATCVVANVSVTDATCSGQVVEMSLFNPAIGVTANSLTVQRAKVPSITSVSPDRGNYSSRPLTIVGVDFVDSTTALCRFTRQSSTNTKQYAYAKATFVTPSEMQCTQPTMTTSNFTLVDLTLDGQVYSSGVSYIVCGPATQIQSSTMNTAITVIASSSWISLIIDIVTVDDTGNALGNLDIDRRSIVAPVSKISDTATLACLPDSYKWRADDDGYPYPPCREITINNQLRNATLATQTPVPAYYSLPNTSYLGDLAFNQTSVRGTARFQLNVYQPRAGGISVQFIAASTTWTTSVSVVIVAGDPYALLIQNKAQRFSTTDYLVIPAKETALAEIDIVVIDRFANPVLGDSAANIAVKADVYSYLFNCTYRKPTTQVFYADCRVFRTTVYATFSRSAGFVPFKDNIFLSNAVHGAYYYIMFQANGSTGNSLLPVVTPAFQTDVCADTEYKVPNSTTCNPCPSPGGICDGTEVIQVDVGYWRAPLVATQIYACDKLSAVCNGSEATWGSTCAGGAAGIMCSGCISIVNSDGSVTYYGKSQLTDCQQCEDQVVNDLLFGLLIVAAFIIIVIWSFCTLRTEQQTDLSVVLRTVVNHMQATGELGQLSTKAGPFLKSIFSVSGGSSTFSIGAVQFFDCFQKQHNLAFEYFFYGIMCLPILAVPVAFGVFGIIRTLNLTPLLGPELRKEIDLQEQQLGPSGAFVSLKTRYPFFMVAATTISVVIFTVYQTLIAQSTSVLLCTNIVVGESFNSSTPSQAKYFLDDDMSIECDANGNSPLLLAGQLFAIGYGFGIPLTFIFGYRFINGRLGMPALTNVIFLFLSGGYKAQYWFWQALIMIRKLLLVLARVFIVDEQVQSAAGMWIMSIALALQLWLSPNEKDDHNKVEAGSLAVITLTLNLGLIYFWPDLSSGGELALNIILIAVTFSGMVMLVIYLVPAALDLVKEVAQDIRDAIGGVKKEQLKLKEKRKKERQRRAMLFNRFPINIEVDEAPTGDFDMTSSVTFASTGQSVGRTAGAGASWRLGAQSSNDGPEYEFDEVDAHAMLSLYDEAELDEDEMIEFEDSTTGLDKQ